jgi:hypothetical protein
LIVRRNAGAPAQATRNNPFPAPAGREEPGRRDLAETCAELMELLSPHVDRAPADLLRLRVRLLANAAIELAGDPHVESLAVRIMAWVGEAYRADALPERRETLARLAHEDGYRLWRYVTWERREFRRP